MTKKNRALVETTWLSKMNDNSQKDYDNQIKNYIEKHLKIKNYIMLQMKRIGIMCWRYVNLISQNLIFY